MIVPLPLHILCKPPFSNLACVPCCSLSKKSRQAMAVNQKLLTPNTELQLSVAVNIHLHVSNTLSFNDQNPEIIMMHIKELTLVSDISTKTIHSLSSHSHPSCFCFCQRSQRSQILSAYLGFSVCCIHACNKVLTKLRG